MGFITPQSQSAMLSVDQWQSAGAYDQGVMNGLGYCREHADESFVSGLGELFGLGAAVATKFAAKRIPPAAPGAASRKVAAAFQGNKGKLNPNAPGLNGMSGFGFLGGKRSRAMGAARAQMWNAGVEKIKSGLANNAKLADKLETTYGTLSASFDELQSRLQEAPDSSPSTMNLASQADAAMTQYAELLQDSRDQLDEITTKWDTLSAAIVANNGLPLVVGDPIEATHAEISSKLLPAYTSTLTKARALSTRVGSQIKNAATSIDRAQRQARIAAENKARADEIIAAQQRAAQAEADAKAQAAAQAQADAQARADAILRAQQDAELARQQQQAALQQQTAAAEQARQDAQAQAQFQLQQQALQLQQQEQQQAYALQQQFNPQFNPQYQQQSYAPAQPGGQVMTFQQSYSDDPGVISYDQLPSEGGSGFFGLGAAPAQTAAQIVAQATALVKAAQAQAAKSQQQAAAGANPPPPPPPEPKPSAFGTILKVAGVLALVGVTGYAAKKYVFKKRGR